MNYLIYTIVAMVFVFGGVSETLYAQSADADIATASELLASTTPPLPPSIENFIPPTEVVAATSSRAQVLPEDQQVKPTVFNERPIETVTPWNFIAYLIQSAAASGLPSETIALVLLMPVLATLIAFVRAIIGLPSLDMLVVIAFAIALLASSLVVGSILLAVIILASMFARIVLRHARLIQMPKTALTMMIVVFILLLSMTAMAQWNLMSFTEISIVPILLLVMLSERISRLQFELAFKKTLRIVVVTLALGVAGYLLFISEDVRSFVLIYPEFVLLVIPLNILMGRYFGLQLTEYFRFSLLEEE